MNIGIVIARIGGVDGVALETEKWIAILRKFGHRIFILSGEATDQVAKRYHITLKPELHFLHPAAVRDQEDAFLTPVLDDRELIDRLDDEVNDLFWTIKNWLEQNSIQMLVSENASALPINLALGIALGRIIVGTKIPTVSHEHDFAWERGKRYISPIPSVMKFVQEYFPPRSPNITHLVINSPAREELTRRFDLHSIVIPNIMDFSSPFGIVDDYNQTMAADLGLNPDDIPLFQITRVVPRKGIDTAIKLVHLIADPKVKLIITGSADDEEKNRYLDYLQEQIDELNLSGQVVFASEFVGAERSIVNGKKIYSLSDAYAMSCACTYFSQYEGFGNAFVEAIASKKPIFVNNYKPVYWPEIGSKGFKTVMIEDNMLTGQIVEEVKEIIYSPELCRAIGEYNYQLGLKHFSYEAIEDILDSIFS